MLGVMKIWMKYLVGALIGVALALVVPDADKGIRDSLAYLFELSIRIGRYALMPLILFSLPIAIFELNEDKEYWKAMGKTILFLFLSVAVFTAIGVAAASIAKPARIPLLADAGSGQAVPAIGSVFLSVFPQNPLAAILSGEFILPVYILAIFLGLAFSHDRSATKPAVQLFDSFSRIFYQINSFIAEVLGIFLIAITAHNIFEFRSALKADVYRSLLIFVGAEVLAMAIIVIPAFIYFNCGKKNPYRFLFGLLAPSLAALFSADAYFSLGTLMKHEKESLGVRRRMSTVILPLAAVAGRAGTALVSASAFVVVLSSYSSLGIPLGSLLWILAVSPLLALLIGSTPGRGAMTALITLCALYGRGFENGYLILLPAALPLAAAGAFLDTIWTGTLTLVMAKNSGHVQNKEARFYI